MASFDLAADPPTVTLEAAYSKHRREDVLPLHPELVARLRQWFTERGEHRDDQRAVLKLADATDAKRERLWPGTWSERSVKMLRSDLDAAGIPCHTEAGFADFHSLRHTFVSNLAAGGVHPKVAQQLARHSSITLTMDRYTHLGLVDMTAGLASLRTVAAPESQTLRATGTTDQNSPIRGCTNGCNAPSATNRFQPVFRAFQTLTRYRVGNPRNPRDKHCFPR
jgi:hypothetical protein